tara:strand:+ start:3069 stop:3380 length:312 start_codon:yes stop_codon:yes gene_type:complete
MKTNYNYFLQRRNLTTKTIIEANQIKNYAEFLVLLEGLKVEPPPLKDVEIYFIKAEVKNAKTKVARKKQNNTRDSSKKKRARSKTPNAGSNVSKRDTGSDKAS